MDTNGYPFRIPLDDLYLSAYLFFWKISFHTVDVQRTKNFIEIVL